MLGRRIPRIALSAPHPTLICALSAGGIAAAGMIAWLTGYAAFLRPDPTSPMLKFTDCLDLLFLAASLWLSVQRSYERSSRLALFPLGMGLLGFLQHLFDFRSFSDTLFVVDRLSAEYHPGRITACSALVSIVLSLGLLVLTTRWSARLLAAMFAGSFGATLGVVALLSRGLPLGANFGGSSFIAMAFWAAVASIALGAGLVVLAWKEGLAVRARTTVWSPVAVAAAVLMATLQLFQTLQSEEAKRVQRLLDAQARVSVNRISANLERRVLAIVRIARRWERTDMRGEAMREEVESLWEPLGAMQRGIGWLSPTGKLRWIFTLEDNDRAELPPPPAMEEPGTGRLRKDRDLSLSEPIALNGGQYGLVIYQPIFLHDKFRGHAVALLNARELLSSAFPPEEAAQVIGSVRLGTTTLFESEAPSGALRQDLTAEFPFHIYGRSWFLKLVPTVATVANETSGLPGTVLFLGVLLALLLGTSFHLAHSAREQARETLKANLELHREIEQRLAAQQQLERLNTELETRVRQRTLQLSEINSELEKEIEERIRFENRLKEANRHALAASRMKSEFLANMSHEIRTPINTIMGTASLMQDCRLDAEQREHVNNIRLAVDCLLSLVNDVLDLSKIEAGKLSLEPSDFRVAELLHGTVEMFGAMAQDKGLAVKTRIAKAVPPILRADAGRIRQVLNNLLGNAIKFTKAGTIEVGLDREPGNPPLLRFSVRDTGIGIDSEALARLFQPFTQADSSTSRKYGGTGLGLSICKRLVDLMGGEIGVESRQGDGSKFSFTVPEVIGKAPAETPRRSRRKKVKPGGRVLVVEDTAMNLKLTIRMLEKLGYRADPAGDGREALRAFDERAYDVILMDCQMPELDGYETTSAIRLREKAAGRHTPIIALTANALAEERERCLAAGMDDYLTKPIDPSRLAETVDRWMTKGRREPARRHRVKRPTVPDPGLA